MENGDQLVKILNDQGEMIGAKPRREVDKQHDILHCADVLVIQNGRLLLSRIPDTTLYGGTLGTSAASMVRDNETPEQAAIRALQKELNVTVSEVTLLGEKFYAFPDGVKRLKTSFVITHPDTITPNPADVSELVAFDRAQIESQLSTNPNLFAPTFQALWQEYQTQLPI